jgi:hypothetical protein
MALSNAIEWDIRSTGSDLNGGGFKRGATGTDYSVQDSPQLSAADLVLVTTTTCSSASAPFSSTSVGNLIQLTAGTGFTTGFYEVLSVAAGVATLDRAAGTGGSTGGTFRLGGGLATIAKCVTATGPIVKGNRVYIKSATYTLTATIAVPTFNADNNGAILFEGYSATHGDRGARPVITTATNSVVLFTWAGAGQGYVFRSIKFSSTAGTKKTAMLPDAGIVYDVLIDDCVFDGLQEGMNGDYTVRYTFHNLRIYRTEIKNCVSHGIINGDECLMEDCFVHANGGDGYKTSTGGTGRESRLTAIRTAFYSNTGKGINSPVANSSGVSHGLYLEHCIVASNGGDGIDLQNNASLNLSLQNNIIISNGGYGVKLNYNVDIAAVNRCNAYYNNTSGARSNLSAGTGDVTLTADPFTSIGTDFSLNNTTGGGAALKQLGFPGTSLLGTGYSSIGPLREQCSAGGSGFIRSRIFTGY